MSDETNEGAEPVRNPRYFTKNGEGVQVVYNLRDASPYAELGYEEVDEAAYLASLPGLDASPLLSPSDGE